MRRNLARNLIITLIVSVLGAYAVIKISESIDYAKDHPGKPYVPTVRLIEEDAR